MDTTSSACATTCCPEPSTWAIVLAAGRGRRLESLTMDPSGQSTPKQFCSLGGTRTLLDEALDRALSLTEPERTLVVVAAEHAAHWARLTQRIPAANVMVQPRDRGTAAGLLLPLHVVLARDPGALVVSLPSDHHVRRERVLEAALRLAVRECRRAPAHVALLGMTPDAPETEFGWILPAPGRWVVRGVERFVEKPSRQVAVELLEQEAVWNSFLLVGAGRAFLDLAARRLPAVASAFARTFEGARPTSSESLERLYGSIPSADLSRDVLQGSEPCLRVQLVPPCGWTDLGTPRRVAECLARRDADECECSAAGPVRLDVRLAALQAAGAAP